MRIGPMPVTLRSPRLASVWGRLRLDERVALALLALAALFRVALVALGWPHLNSDEAVVGLMARHIVQDGARPIFIWGVHYEGPFEAYIAAPFFALFGSSTLTLHLSNQLLVLAFLLVMYVLTRAVFGRLVALATALWLGFGSTFAIHREIVTVGGYQEILLLGALLLLLAWSRLRRPEALPRGRREWLRCLAVYAGIGCCIGLGVWSSLLIVPLVILTVLALAVCRWRELARGGGVVAALAALLSALPYLSYQFPRAFPALVETRRISHPNLAAPALASQTLSTLAIGLPTLYGSPITCPGQRGGVSGSPICTVGNTLLSLVILSLFAAVAWGCLLAVWQVLRRGARPAAATLVALGGERSAETAERQARWWLRVILLGVVVASLAGYLPSPDATAHPQSSARYLLPMLLAAPLVLDLLVRVAIPSLRRALDTRRSPHTPAQSLAFRRLSWSEARSRLAVMGLGFALALALANCVITVRGALGRDAGGLPPPGDRALMTFLRTRGINAFYADYWTCYRLAFESDERIHCAVRGQNGEDGLELINNHYPPYIATVAQQPHPAYILPVGTATDEDFTREAANQRLPYHGYQRVVVEDYAIYYYP